MTNTETLKEIQEVLRGEFISPATGEVLTGEQIKELIQLEEGIKRTNQLQGLRRKQQKDFINNEVCNMLGGDFIYQQYTNTVNVILEEYEKFNSAFAFRFVYLASFMNYDNILVFDNRKKGASKYIEERDLMEVLGLSKKQVLEFKKVCFNQGLIEKVQVEGITVLKINKLVACKGNLPAYYKRYSIRVSVPHLQDIYKRATPREHKQLGYLTALLPYINFEYSLLCLNPDCEYKAYLQPMTIQDICKILNYDITKASRLLTVLRKTTLNGEYVFLTINLNNKDAFFLNPKVYYKGSTPTALKWLDELFTLAKLWEENNKKKNRKVPTLKEMVSK